MQPPSRGKVEKPRLIPDGELKVMQLDGNPIIVLKIGVDLPALVKINIINFLKANAYLFVIFLDEMSCIDPCVTCHQLNIDPSIKYMALRRLRKSLEKVDATRNTI